MSRREPPMSKYVVDGELLNYLVDTLSPSAKSNICPSLGDCPKVNSCLECLAEHSGKVLPLAPAQERAGDEEEWCVVNKCKLMELLDDGNEHSPAMRLFKKQEAIKYLATPQGKEGEK